MITSDQYEALIQEISAHPAPYEFGTLKIELSLSANRWFALCQALADVALTHPDSQTRQDARYMFSRVYQQGMGNT
jgi:hypothetical protein